MKKEEFLKKIENCRLCGLCEERTKIVPGEGRWDSEILFIGEGPGKEEDLQGKPFVGAAGRVLTEMIEAIGLSRDEVFITNVVKCRPPSNRDPLPGEIKACWNYLEDQIKIIKPKLIVLLGRHSLEHFLPGLKISQVHGSPKRSGGIWQEKQIYLPLYHPAVALYDPRKKAVLLEGFKKIPLILKKIDELS